MILTSNGEYQINKIVIKSVASNRVRLKSDIFHKVSNLEIIQKEFKDIFLSFRENRKCKSIVFTYKKSIALDEIINKLNSLFVTSGNFTNCLPLFSLLTFHFLSVL